MKIEEAKKLANGVYKIYWKSGGSSVASVGRLYGGTLWFAPANWTSQDEEGVASTNWEKVEKVKLIKESKT